MKNSSGTRAVSILLLTGIFFMTARPVSAQNALATPVAQTVSDVVARGQHFKVLERVRQTTNFTGEVTTKTNHYTVVANGLNFQDTNGNWIESHPVVQSYAGGIACVGASYSVILATNLNTAGAVDLETSDGQRLISNPLGLGFYDPDTGKSVVLAQVKDCGAVVSSNHILYPDAFTGLKASVEYVYDIGHFHQNITLLTAPSTQPSDYGMGSRTRLEMLSELLQGPTPVTTTHVLSSVTDPTQRAAMAAPDVVDQTLKFGSMSMGLGRAYPVGGLATNQPGMTVPKQLINQSGRNILIESVPWAAASALLAQPQQSASIGSPSGTPGLTRDLPAARTAQTGTNFTARLAQVTKSSPVKLALNSNNGRAKLPLSPNHGFTLDYDLVETCTDFDFYEGGTFLVVGDLSLDGTTIIDDTVVLKYADFAKLTINGTIVNPGYTPSISALVLTSLDNDSVGDIIDGSTGNPSVDYSGAPALDVEYLDSDLSFAELDFSYCYGGLWVDNSPGRTLSVGAANYINVPGGNSIGSVNLVAFTSISVCNITGMTTSNEFTGANITVGSFIDCHDANGNGIPDDWEMANFGALVSATGDYDGDGVDNYHEWLNGTDPNKIQFHLGMTNTYVNTSNAYGNIQVLDGVPSQMAVLVNSTNWAGATWQTYNATVPIPLGATDGLYNVWVGLRGRLTTSKQTWEGIHVMLDTEPPLIEITNPVPGTVSRPLIQLQGYSLEPLSSLTYDVSNAAGIQTNLLGHIMRQFSGVTSNSYSEPGNPYGTGPGGTITSSNTPYGFTSNWFECFDIGLTNGTNLITLHAVDLAGNQTNLENVYNLDYSTATNPPVLTLYWPQNGDQVSGGTFTVRGVLDNPTASVTAQIVDTNGNTNIASGNPGPNGEFLVSSLPLASGTNYLSLTATDAASNSVTTNLVVVRGAVNLTIDDLSGTDMTSGAITVTGTIDTANYSVWVNGMQATVTGNTWSAANVNVTHNGSAIFEARAIPSADHGGSGTGGGGSPASTNLANPNSLYAQTVEALFEGPAYFYIESYHLNRHDYVSWPFYNDYTGALLSDEWANLDLHIDWDNGAGGTEAYDSHESTADTGDNPDEDMTWFAHQIVHYVWPPTLAPLPLPNTSDTAWDPSTSAWVTGSCPPPTYYSSFLCQPPYGPVMEECDYDVEADAPYDTWQRTATTVVKLNTGGTTGGGGTAGSHSNALFEVHVTTTIAGIPLSQQLPTNMTPDQFTVGAYGHPGADGILWVVLPVNEQPDFTVHAPAYKYYTFLPTVIQHDLISQCLATIPTNRGRTELGVGEQVFLSFQPTNLIAMTWKASDGLCLWQRTTNLFPTNLFIAPSNANSNVKITISDPKTNIVNGPMTLTFSVVEPVGYVSADITGTDSFQLQLSGAGMTNKVIIGPTNVSFYRVQIYEIGEDASSDSGYFLTSSPPPISHIGNGANVWHPLAPDNSWLDHSALFGYPQPWSTGSFTWVIPARWMVGTDPTRSPNWTNQVLAWTNQIFGIDASGNMTVQKYGHTVTRNTNNVYITVH